MTLDECFAKIDADHEEKLTAFVETMHRVPDLSDEEIEAIKATQHQIWVEWRAKALQDVKAWLERNGEPLQ